MVDHLVVVVVAVVVVSQQQVRAAWLSLREA